METHVPWKSIRSWKSVTTDDGRVYYWNTTTDETTWRKPGDGTVDGVPVSAAPVSAAPVSASRFSALSANQAEERAIKEGAASKSPTGRALSMASMRRYQLARETTTGQGNGSLNAATNDKVLSATTTSPPLDSERDQSIAVLLAQIGHLIRRRLLRLGTACDARRWCGCCIHWFSDQSTRDASARAAVGEARGR